MTTTTRNVSISSWLADGLAAQVAACFRGRDTRTFSLVGGAVVLWASWPTLATVAYPAPPFLVLGLAALVGFALSFCLTAVRGRARSFWSVSPATLIFVAFGLMGNNAFYLAAISRIGPAEANVVHYLWPIFLVILSAFVVRRAPTPVQVVGITCGFSGVAIALSPQMGAGFDAVGVLLGISGALTFAVYSVGRSLAKVETNVVGPSLGLAGAGALAVHVLTEPVYMLSATQWGAIALMGLGPFTLANILWDRATRQGAAATISSLAFLTPLVALSLLVVFGLSTLTLQLVVGAVLTIAGAVLGTRR